MPRLLVSALFTATAAGAGAASVAVPPAGYTLFAQTDITPCIDPCVRVGNCGYSTPNPVCNITLIAALCDAACGCAAFNSNGWLKGCGNTSCGVTFENESGVDTYVRGDGVPPGSADVPVASIDDDFYPPEEVSEAAGAAAPAVVSASAAGQWALLRQPGGDALLNASVGDGAFGFTLLAVLDSPAAVVVERSFARWGFLAYVAVGGGELTRLRKGTGAVYGLSMPNYAGLPAADCLYYSKVAGDASDWLGHRILNETDGEATFAAAAKYLPPQRDYAVIGGIEPYQKWSVAPDGRVKSADTAIYTPDLDPADPGPGLLVWDPRPRLPPGTWPPANFTFLKSGLVGGHLRVVSTVAFSPATSTGFEQLAFAPAAGNPTASAFIRLRAVNGPETAPFVYTYWNASAPAVAATPQPLSPASFYAALLAEQAAWNATFAGATAYSLPGQEGARQVATARGALVASLSLYIGLQPNYGDGADYWSPQVDRGGSLPFQEIAVVQALLEGGLPDMAAARLGWWMDAYVDPDGSISTGGWEPSCPFGFADGWADYGQMLDLFARVARGQAGYNAVNGSAWVAAHAPQAAALANYTYGWRAAAAANASNRGTPIYGLVWGPPEHDTCHDPGFYYHNNAWWARGLLEIGRLFRDLCPTLCPTLAPLGAVYAAEGAAMVGDVLASIALTATTRADGSVLFIPPIAQLGFAPFRSMIESTVAEYSNFRYYSELLGADVLTPSLSAALQDFRESTMGTVSGITRWSDHLDDMPSSYYLAASLREDRLPRFLLLQYGHMANYMGRGTLTATEQLPIGPDGTGFFRDYLWSYLEGGIDECVPSIMLPAIATRWQMVLERYDAEVLWLGKGAPRRWADPAGGGYGVTGATTRFGTVSLTVTNAARADGHGQDAAAAVSFAAPPAGVVPGVTATPQFAVRLRSSDARDALAPASVGMRANTAGAVIACVDAAAGIVWVNITAPGAFTVTASLLH